MYCAALPVREKLEASKCSSVMGKDEASLGPFSLWDTMQPLEKMNLTYSYCHGKNSQDTLLNFKKVENPLIHPFGKYLLNAHPVLRTVLSIGAIGVNKTRSGS